VEVRENDLCYESALQVGRSIFDHLVGPEPEAVEVGWGLPDDLLPPHSAHYGASDPSPNVEGRPLLRVATIGPDRNEDTRQQKHVEGNGSPALEREYVLEAV